MNESIKEIAKLQQYIEDHIHDEITLLKLARESNYSPWYVDKLFKKHVNKSPMQYIKERRLTLAALMLRDHPMKVMDVALEFLFDSHEGFTRAFSKHFGISPYRYKVETPAIRLFLPYIVSDYKSFEQRRTESVETQAIPIFTQVIERPERKLILKRGEKAKHYFAYCEEVGCDIWGILTSIKEALYEPVGLWLPNKLKAGKSTYVQGVEVPLTYDKSIPDGFEIITLKPQFYMIFQGPKYDDCDFMEAIDRFNQAVSTFDPTVYGYEFDLDEAPVFQLEPRGERGYIEAKPIRKINL
ncbi:MAG: AraC family transcriptional regulator [Acholeplasma sp.]|jgi:AraC-like DNA-binding protein|nr:MAG: AraC family transcriptional regulator [Acholeplasma sp.]